MILGGQGQLRFAPLTGRVVGFDMAALAALGSARGMAGEVLTELLAAAEQGLMLALADLAASAHPEVDS